jgi:phosphoserine phosphatase
VAKLPYRLVTLDIDGTLTLGHGWETVAERLGRSEMYGATQTAFRAGALDEDAHLRNLLAIADGASEEELSRILSETPKVDGIEASVARLHRLGSHVALLTHNPGYVTRWYATRFGFDAADGLTGSPTVTHGRIGPPVGTAADKLGGLRRLCERFAVGPRDVAHVGDGRADAAIFPHVALGVAFRTKLPDVRAVADVAVDGPSLLAVVDALERTPPARR